MSDSLTRLILRAQGRPSLRPATAEPLLASRYENDFGLAPAAAEPWTADETDPAGDRTEGSSRGGAHDWGSPRDARTCDDRTPGDPWEPTGNRPAAPPAGGLTQPTDARGRTADGAGEAGFDGADAPAPLARAPIGRPEENDPTLRPLQPRQSSIPSRTGDRTAEPRDASPQAASDAFPARIAVEAVPAPSALAVPRSALTGDPAFSRPTRAQSDPIRAWTARSRDEPAPAPDVRISIGLVEVHAVPPRPSPSRPSTVRRPATSLAEYLGQRAGRSS